MDKLKATTRSTTEQVKTDETTALGALNFAVISTINLVGSPWILDWDGGLVTMVNIVAGAWLIVASLGYKALKK